MGVGFGEEVSFSVSSPLLGKLVGLQYSSCLWLLWFIPAGEWHNPCLVLRPCCPDSSHSEHNNCETRGDSEVAFKTNPKCHQLSLKEKFASDTPCGFQEPGRDSAPSTMEPFRTVLAPSVPLCATSSHAPGHPVLALCLLQPTACTITLALSQL